MDINILRQYKEKREEKAKLSEQLKMIEGEIKLLEDMIINNFADEGIKSINVDGKTITTSSQIWAKIAPDKKEEAKHILRELGLDSIITLNYQSLSAYIREIVKSGEELPEQFRDVIGYHDKVGLRMLSK